MATVSVGSPIRYISVGSTDKLDNSHQCSIFPGAILDGNIFCGVSSRREFCFVNDAPQTFFHERHLTL